MPKVRVTEPCVVRQPGGQGNMVALVPDRQYDSDDPLVKAYPWAFAADNETQQPRRGVEQATANPGQQRR